MGEYYEETVTANGLQFETLVQNGGEKVAIFMHGFPDNARTLAPLFDVAVSNGYMVVAPYMRGYGETDPAPDNYLTVNLGYDVIGLADAFDGSETVLIGHDWGGNAAYMAAGIAPNRFSKLIALTVPPPCSRTVLRAIGHHPKQLARAWYKLFFQLSEIPDRALKANDFALIGRLWRLWSPNWDYSQSHLAAVKETFRTGDTPEAALRYYRDRFRAEYFDLELDGFEEHKRVAANPVQVPSLLLTGDWDRSIGSELFYGLNEAIEAPHKIIKLPRGGHWFHREYPDRVARLVDDFLAED